MSALFDRVYDLQVGPVRVSTSLGGAANIAFSAERHLRRRPGRCEVRIWNLSEDNRRAIHALTGRIFVSLSAGYAEAGPGLIFRGELGRGRARTEEQGNDLITKIASRDGASAHRARTSRSVRPGGSVVTAVRGLVDDMGIDTGNLESVLGSISIDGSPVLSAGASFFGSAADNLDRVLGSSGHEWSIQDGALQVLPRGTTSSTVVDLRPETGLQSRPVRTDAGKIEVETALLPALLPGVRVRLSSGDEQGTFRCESVLLRGEFAGKEWGCKAVLGEVTR